MEILQFSAERFCAITSALAQMEKVIEQSKAEERVIDPAREELTRFVTDIAGHCSAINLTMSLRSVVRLSEAIQKNENYVGFKGQFEELSTRIRDEISDNLFLFIPKSHVTYYTGKNLFGESVANNFSSATYDITEAGKCLALRRNTAAVCHLMRVLEIGLRALATRLHVPCENKPWNYVIEVADNRLKKIRSAKRKPKDWKASEQFYSEAIAHYRFLKDAWRNYSMHVYERYDEEQAETIFNHTRAFMRHLATKLSEARARSGSGLDSLPRTKP